MYYLIFHRENIFCEIAKSLIILLQSCQKHILTLTIAFELAAEAGVHRGLIFGEHIILLYSH